MSTILFSVFIIVLLAISIYFYLQNRQNSDKLTQLDSQSREYLLLLEEEKRKSTVFETEKKMLSKQLEDEKAGKEQNEKTLKEQLELMGKELILRGGQAIRSENELQLNQLLTPFKEKIEAFEKEVKSSALKESERYINMQAIIKNLSEQHMKMNQTAQNLADALKGSQKMQGDWGEMALERILEMSGLQKGREYDTQVNFKDEDGSNMRPDVVINLPDNKHVIIDAKVSMVSFERYINAEDEEEKPKHLTNHLISIRSHVKQLGEKNYTHLKGVDTPEFVLMFIPLESSFALAMKEEPGLYQFAWEKRVVMVTPSTLLATLKTIESIWKQERQNRHALDIADQAGKLYDKFHGFLGDMETIGKKQKDAQSAYEDAMKKLSSGPGNLITSTEKLRTMGAKAKKQLDSKFLTENEGENQ